MDATYDKAHVESVLTRAGVPPDRRNAILDEIHFPIDLTGLQAVLSSFGITRDDLVNRLGGSP